MRICPKCGAAGPFSKDRRAPDGLTRLCKVCDAARRKVTYHTKPGVKEAQEQRAMARTTRLAPALERAQLKAATRAVRSEEATVYGNAVVVIVRGLYRGAVMRAREGGYPCTITREYLSSLWTGTCPVLGIPLVSGQDTAHNSPTLDKIVPALGYVPGNVAIISRRANAIKSDATAGEILKVYEWLSAITPQSD